MLVILQNLTLIRNYILRISFSFFIVCTNIIFFISLVLIITCYFATAIRKFTEKIVEALLHTGENLITLVVFIILKMRIFTIVRNMLNILQDVIMVMILMRMKKEHSREVVDLRVHLDIRLRADCFRKTGMS